MFTKQQVSLVAHIFFSSFFLSFLEILTLVWCKQDLNSRFFATLQRFFAVLSRQLLCYTIKKYEKNK